MERKKARGTNTSESVIRLTGGLRKREREDFHDATSQAANKTLLQRDAAIVHRWNTYTRADVESRATFHANAAVGRDRIYTTTIWHHIPATGTSRHKLPLLCPWETTYRNASFRRGFSERGLAIERKRDRDTPAGLREKESRVGKKG